MRKLSMHILIGLFLMGSFQGCNMFRGAGKDISNAGHNIQNAGK